MMSVNGAFTPWGMIDRLIGRPEWQDFTTGAMNASGSKYLREIPCLVDGKTDVYAVLDAFNVTCPARQHAIKKLLCAGLRGKNNEEQDIREALDAVSRALQMLESK